MNVGCNRSALSEALGIVGGVVALRTPKPVLECVRFCAEKDSVVLLGTDLEVGIRYVLSQVTVSQPGEILVPADKLAAVVRESGDEVLEIASIEQGCQVIGADSRFDLYGQDPAEFPPVPRMEGQPDMTIKAGVLERMIHRTVFAAARENTRYAINGVLWEKQGKTLVMVATDGRRLARTEGQAEMAADGHGEAIVPVKTMGLIGRLLNDPDELVSVRMMSNQILVSTGRATVSSVLVEGRFPKYEDVIPRDNDKVISFGIGVLSSAVRRAALMTTEDSKGVRFNFRDGHLELSGRSAGRGEAVIRLSVEYKGVPIEIGFNPVYLLDGLKVVGADAVELALSEPNKPGMIRSSDGFLCVIMPVSLS